MDVEFGLYSIGSAHEPVANSCEHGTKP